MSYNDEYPHKSSHLPQPEDDENDGNAPTQPMPRVRTAARSIAQLPAPPQQKAPLKEQIAWSASAYGEKPFAPHRDSNRTSSTSLREQAPFDVALMPTKPLQPPQVLQPPRPAQPLAPIATIRHPKKRRLALPVALVLVVLAVLIVLGGVFAHSFSTGSPTVQGQSVVLPTGHTGAFEAVPLTPLQVNQLQHLNLYMQYKQLASMYVQRMSLDEEIGQLIMVEYSSTSYSSDLNYMINQLHAGGVIMYAFQMKTFAQTKHDISE